MKWTELVDRVVLQFGTNPHNKAIARKFLEEGERDLAYHTKAYIKDKTIVCNNDDNMFDMPADFLELKSAITANEHQLQPYREQINRIKGDGTQVTGTPRYYMITSQQLILVPHPDEETLINFQYIAQPTAVEANKTYKKINYKNLDNGFFQQGVKVKGSVSGATGVVHSDRNDLKNGTLILGDVVDGSLTLTMQTQINQSSNSIVMTGDGSLFGIVPSNGHLLLEWTNSETGSHSDTVSYSNSTRTNSSITFTDVNGIGSVIPMGAKATFTSEFRQNEVLFTLDDSYDLAVISGSYTFATLTSQWDSLGLGARATSASLPLTWNDLDILSPVIPDIYHLYLVDYAKSMLAEQEKEFELSDRFMAKYLRNRELVRGQISGKGTGSGTMVVADLSFRGNIV
jgi:hypothetical protein